MTPINAMNDLLADLRRHPTNEELVRSLMTAAAAPAVTDGRSAAGG